MMRSVLCYIALSVLVLPLVAGAEDPPADSSGAPQVLLDKNPRIVAYQLKRLNNAQLIALERKTDDRKYVPVYEALLTRKGLDKKYRDEAVAALVTLNKSDPVTELLSAIGKTDADDKGTLRELIALLVAQKPAALTAQRDKLDSLATGADGPVVKEAAYAALATADGKPDQVWAKGSGSPESLRLLLGSLSMISDPKVRASFYERVRPLAEKAPNDQVQAAAIEALGYVPGHEAEMFTFLAGLVENGKGEQRAAAVRAIRRIPQNKWPANQLEALGKAIVSWVGQTPADQRTTPEIAGAVQLGDDVAGALPESQGAPIRKSLRDLGVRVIAIRTIREQMAYDVRYFVVQVGKPVEVLLENDDAMPHNIVIVAPGALQEVAVAGGVLPPPTDPNAKAYVPNSPKVVQATHLVQPDETSTLVFNAPDKVGEYPFMCTFPGHWVRMYGVMLVVPDLEAWEKSPKAPSDPLTRAPLKSQKNAPESGGGHQH